MRGSGTGEDTVSEVIRGRVAHEVVVSPAAVGHCVAVNMRLTGCICKASLLPS